VRRARAENGDYVIYAPHGFWARLAAGFFTPALFLAVARGLPEMARAPGAWFLLAWMLLLNLLHAVFASNLRDHLPIEPLLVVLAAAGLAPLAPRPKSQNRPSRLRPRPPMKTVIVIGKGDLAIRVAAWFLASPDHRLISAVPAMPEPTWVASFADWARSNQVPVVESGHYKDLPGVGEPGWKVDLVFSVFYDKIVKAWFIEKCGRILNLHNGPLPKYRGVSPINWALKNGETEHGLTIHEITPGIDDGPVVAQLKYSIYPDSDEVVDVYRRSLEYGWILFQQTMPLLDKIEARVQDGAQASYYSKEQDPQLGERRNFTREKSR
jgi:hypothetical protein